MNKFINFKGYEKMRFQNKNLSESLLDSNVNIAEKTRSNLFRWRGQFSPQLVEQLLLAYSSIDDVVFDPFLGSGTVLFPGRSIGYPTLPPQTRT